jgi:hypothetical protein
VNKVKNLEAEKMKLLVELEELRKRAEEKSGSLENEIALLRNEIESLKNLMGQEKEQLPNSNELPKEIQNPEKGLIEKTPEEELIEKTLDESNKLGNQIFEHQPYSQYFDGWLVNLEKILSEFASSSKVDLDEKFVKDRSRIFIDIERALDQKRLEESKLSLSEKALEETNQLMAENDQDYDKKTKELNSQRNTEIEPLNNRIHDLEEEILSKEEKRLRIFKPLTYTSKKEWREAKKKASEQLDQTKKDLESSKGELEKAQHSFDLKQAELDENYKKKQQEVKEKADSLRNEIERLKMDTSIDDRRAASKELANAINALIERSQVSLEKEPK